VDGLTYMNCGDWVENCTALVEDLEGKFHLIKMHERKVPSPGAQDAGLRDEPEVEAAGASRGGRAGGPKPEPATA
jgi:hypothetical protein